MAFIEPIKGATVEMDLKYLIEESCNNPFSIGNDVLYKLCKAYPYHTNREEVIAKVWLIGRSYAASIERRKNKKESNDNYYTEKVAPMIISGHVDRWIDDAKNNKTAEAIIRTHKEVTTLFYQISKLEKRSLASKYLHFHEPDLFYIYDSRAGSAINKLLTELKIKKYDKKVFSEEDERYSSFWQRCDIAAKEINKRFNLKGKNKVNCRILDNILISISNREQIKKSK